MGAIASHVVMMRPVCAGSRGERAGGCEFEGPQNTQLDIEIQVVIFYTGKYVNISGKLSKCEETVLYSLLRPRV